MDLLFYVPAKAQGPSPLLLNISFSANSTTVDDPGVQEGEVWNRDHKKVPAKQGMVFGKVDVLPLIEAGFGFATVYYGEQATRAKSTVRNITNPVNSWEDWGKSKCSRSAVTRFGRGESLANARR